MSPGLSLTSFVGRVSERGEIRSLLGHVRLLTLTGAGGCGKTRLAQQVCLELTAAHLARMWWVELADLQTVGLVPQTVAQAVGLRETPHTDLVEALSAYLATNDGLLVLDNCEHVLAGCTPLVRALLAHCPGLQILATSREPLGLPDETSWLVPSLALPEAAQPAEGDPSRLVTLAQVDAIRLFVERAATAVPHFALTVQNAQAVTQICRRLDGLPLAIELAAARVKVLTVQQIATRLDDSVSLLAAGNPTALIPRHETLRAALDWSFDLLSEPERILLRRLAVFAGGFSLEGAEAIGADETLPANSILGLLERLVDKSLMVAETQGRVEARYRLLEIVRQYAAEKLQVSGEAPLVHRRHSRWFLRLAEQAEGGLRGFTQKEWLERLEAEHDNLRAALAWSLAEARESQPADGYAAETALRLAGSLHGFWNLRGYWSEGLRWLEGALELRLGHDLVAARAKAHTAAGQLARQLSDYEAERRHHEQGVAMWREVVARATGEIHQDLAPEVQRRSPPEADLAVALCGLATSRFYDNDYPAAQALIEASLQMARSIDARWELAYVLYQTGFLARYQGDLTTAQRRLGESAAYFREAGDRWGLGLALLMQAIVGLDKPDDPLLRLQLDEAISIFRDVGDRWNLALALSVLGEMARGQGGDERARALYEDALVIHRELGAKWGLSFSLHNLGHVALHQGDTGRAADLFHEALALNQERHDPLGTASCLAGLAGVAALGGSPHQAGRLFGRAQALLDEIGLRLAPTDALEFERNIQVVRARLGNAAFGQAWDAGRALSMAQALELARRILGEARTAQLTAPVEPLNPREQEVLRLIAQGLSNHEIAERLTVSLNTVKWYVNNLFGKLDVKSRTKAIVRGKELNLL